jgi:hypothetical protein
VLSIFTYGPSRPGTAGACSLTSSPTPALPLRTDAGAGHQARPKNRPPGIGPAGSTSTSDPHTQDVKGLNEAALVGVRGRRSNHGVWLDLVATLREFDPERS